MLTRKSDLLKEVSNTNLSQRNLWNVHYQVECLLDIFMLELGAYRKSILKAERRH